MFSLPLFELLLYFPRNLSVDVLSVTHSLFITKRCCPILPGNKMWQKRVQFERMRNGQCESFLLFLNTCFLFLSAGETLFQQMGKTDITINLFFKRAWDSNVIHHICFIVWCVYVCVFVNASWSVLQDVCVLMFVGWNRWCSDLSVQLRNLLMLHREKNTDIKGDAKKNCQHWSGADLFAV